MFPYRPGDIVRVYHYPYVSKAEQVHNEPSSPGKARYGLVINSGGKGVTAIPIMPIISRSGKTEESTYRLREDEVRVPHNTYYPTHTGEKQLHGVIKTERLERFGPNEISAPLTTVPLRTKIDILERYNIIKQIPYFKNLMDRQSPGHESFMKDFEESVVAEKLNFLVNENGVRKFDAMRNSALKMTEINPITKMGKNNRISLYSVKLQGRKDSFQYTMDNAKLSKNSTHTRKIY